MKIHLLTISVLCSFALSAQSFSKNNSFISSGYGIGTIQITMLDIFSELTTESITGPVFFKYEYAVAEQFGMGLNIAYLYVNYSYEQTTFDDNGNPVTSTVQEGHHRYSLLARMNFHFGDLKKFDPYFGVGLGYRSPLEVLIRDGNSIYTYHDENIFGAELTLGGRLYLTNRIGLYAELGLAKSAIQGGLVFQLGKNEASPAEAK